MSSNPFKEQKGKKKYKINRLLNRALELREQITEIKDVEDVDMTDELFIELDQEVKNYEIINIQINAKPRMGKSTLAIFLAIWILARLIFYKMTPKREFGIQNIARDDQEYAKKMRNPDLMFDVIVTDEENAMETTGENATVEMAQKKVFSDIHAGRYVHRVSCCPNSVIDSNCDILLEIRNKENGLIHSILNYKTTKAGIPNWNPLGKVDVDVSKLIYNWEYNVKSIFYRYMKDKKPEDKEKLKKEAQKDFYVLYMIKKHEKMEMMTREGILRPRDLDYAEIQLRVIEDLKGLAKMKLTDTKSIRGRVEYEFRKEKIPVSIVGLRLASERIEGVLNLYTKYFELIQMRNSQKKQFSKGGITNEELNENQKTLDDQITKTRNIIQAQIKEFERYAELNKKYNLGHGEILL